MADSTDIPTANPLDSTQALQPGSADAPTKRAHPQDEILPGDSAVTKAEKVERQGNGVHTNGSSNDAAVTNGSHENDNDERASKRPRIEPSATQPGRIRGVAQIKAEYLVEISSASNTSRTNASGEAAEHDDDAAEASGKSNNRDSYAGRGGQKTQGGQNKGRTYGSSRDAMQLCKSRSQANEFAPQTCRFGDKCKYLHDIRKYLKDGKREDLQTFNGACPIWEVKDKCSAGWSCRFAGSHSREVEREDGRKELVMLTKEDNAANGDAATGEDEEDGGVGVVNVVSIADKIILRKKKWPSPKSDEYVNWLNKSLKDSEAADGDKKDGRAAYVEPPFRASEKRRIYYGPETPVLAPLTTQGNLPFRRLCVSLGAQLTWSEMAMGLQLISGDKGEFALIKAHESEMTSPKYTPKSIVTGYDNSKDFRFGAQIAANKPWLALKTTEVLTSLCPRLRAIDLNCGCPIDLVCRQGAGSALLDAPGRLEKTLRGMNAVSGETPITVKIRMGTVDKRPTAERLCQRLILGGQEVQEHGEDPSGVAAITLHGRSKQQRYTRSADWEYIAECATLVNKLKSERGAITDTIREPDARDLPATYAANDGLPYFCGNGDVMSHVDYNEHITKAGVATCMIGRGALVKPWVFEEIESNQYLDKSASERLGYIEQFVRNGLEYWGSDEIGVGNTRRFLLEWLSFASRYVPLGLLEYLPPRLGDRPPAFKGRNELETLLSSANYKDWIKISEMFLGPAHKDFVFQPKHKSNSYEIEAEG